MKCGQGGGGFRYDDGWRSNLLDFFVYQSVVSGTPDEDVNGR